MGITLFLAHKKIFQNKLSEIVNNKLKMLVVLIVLRKDTQGLCALNKTQPSQFKHKSNTTSHLVKNINNGCSQVNTLSHKLPLSFKKQ
jgi:predicted glutamine amidotransferase